jgi:hypothetical protein
MRATCVAISFFVLVLASGCIPALVPPMRISVGPSVSAGIRNVDPMDHNRTRPLARADLVGTEVRTSFEPLNLVGGEVFDAHRIDLGIGYVFVTTGTPSQRFTYHGGFLETGVRLFSILGDDTDDHSHRFELHVAAEILRRRFDGIDEPGYGARLSLDYERGFGFSSPHTLHRAAHSPWVGHVRGDRGIGASLAFALRTIGDDRALTVTLALTFRAPGVVGALNFVH